MKRLIWNVLSFIPAIACIIILACGDDSSSTSPQEDVPVSSSVAGAPGLSSDALPLSSAVTGISSAVIESSSSVAVPTQLCMITLVTETGYPNIAVTTGFPWICAPMANCDTSSVNTGFSQCNDGRATVEGCISSAEAEVVESCGDDLEPTCETPNGPVYMRGRIIADCSEILR